MPDSSSARKWIGVSYIGNITRMDWNFRPCVQSPLPFQACSPLPVVMNPIWISPFSRSVMFSFGPSVGRVETRMPRSRVRIRANPSP